MARAPAPKLEFARWILWEDDALLAVDKPAGVLSQGGEGGEGVNVVDLARAYLSSNSSLAVIPKEDVEPHARLGEPLTIGSKYR